MEVCITQSLYKTPRAPTEFTAMRENRILRTFHTCESLWHQNYWNFGNKRGSKWLQIWSQIEAIWFLWQNVRNPIWPQHRILHFTIETKTGICRCMHFRRAPLYFPKAHPLRYKHRRFGNDLMHIRGEWTFKRWPWIKFDLYHLWC